MRKIWNAIRRFLPGRQHLLSGKDPLPSTCFQDHPQLVVPTLSPHRRHWTGLAEIILQLADVGPLRRDNHPSLL